jgi:hypothetical protein
VVAETEPLLGSHVVTPRRGYLHYGIYLGDRKVVHCAGFANGLRRGPVEEISLARLSDGPRVRATLIIGNHTCNRGSA